MSITCEKFDDKCGNGEYEKFDIYCRNKEYVSKDNIPHPIVAVSTATTVCANVQVRSIGTYLSYKRENI